MNVPKTLAVALCCLLTSICFAQTPTHTPKYVALSANTKAFYEYLPAGYDAGGTTRYPVILFLHGAGDIGDGSPSELPRLLEVGIPKLIHQGAFPTLFTVNSQTFKFIVISPQFTKYPSPADAANDVENILNYIGQNYKADLNRIYVTGISMGGGFTFDYAGNSVVNAKRLAAIVPIANASYPVQAKARVIADANLPVWSTHNDTDPSVPVSQTTQYTTWINDTPTPAPPARQTIFSSNLHDAWTATYDPSFRENGLNIYEWMLQFQRSSLLPVSLGLYQAAAHGSTVVVDWTTVSEASNAYFTVERSADGTSFTSIGWVEGLNRAGTYSFTDRSPAKGTNYYRVAQRDKDGRTTYYGVLKVSAGANGTLNLSVTPNPAHGFVQLQIKEITGSLYLTLHNAAGAVIKKWTVEKGVSDYSQTVQLGQLPEGVYFLHVAGKSISEKVQFVKKK